MLAMPLPSPPFTDGSSQLKCSAALNRVSASHFQNCPLLQTRLQKELKDYPRAASLSGSLPIPEPPAAWTARLASIEKQQAATAKIAA